MDAAALEEIISTVDHRLALADEDISFSDASYIVYCKTKAEALAGLADLSEDASSVEARPGFLVAAVEAYDRALSRAASSQDGSIGQCLKLELALKASKFQGEVVGDVERAKAIAEETYHTFRTSSVKHSDQVVHLLEQLRSYVTATTEE